MVDTRTQQWATALKKGQYRARQSADTRERSRQLHDAIKYYKKQLADACTRKAEDEMQSTLEKLIKLRAELCAMSLTASKERTRTLRAYYTDCHRLARTAQLLLKP